MKKHITVLLTGRGNNTLPDKNILPVFGRPLLQYPALAAKAVELIDDFFVSSDDDNILAAAAEVGYLPIKRPKALGRPDAQHVDVIDHALEVLKDKNIIPNILIVILANHVTTKKEWIRECVEFILDDPALTAVVPVYKEMDHHPYRAKGLDENGLLKPMVDLAGKKVSTNRQDLPVNYFLSHNFWVLNLDAIHRATGQPPWTFMGDKVKPYPVEEAFDIHNMTDLKRSEEWLIAHNLKP